MTKPRRFAKEFEDEAVRLVALDCERDDPSRWAAVGSMAEKIGCVPQTLREWLNVNGVTLMVRIASATGRPCDSSPSTGRSFATISSG